MCACVLFFFFFLIHCSRKERNYHCDCKAQLSADEGRKKDQLSLWEADGKRCWQSLSALKMLSISNSVALHVSGYMPQNLRHGNFNRCPDTLLLMFFQSYFLFCRALFILCHLASTAFPCHFYSIRAELIFIAPDTKLLPEHLCASPCFCCTVLGLSRVMLLAVEES